MEDSGRHRSVLLHEATDGLTLKPGSVVVDATGGGGGHSARILEMLAGSGSLIVIEQDPAMVAKLKDRLNPGGTALQIVCGNFRNIADIVAKSGHVQVDAVLADLGWNSEQFEDGQKGFSFKKDEPLLMTYGDPARAPFTAEDIVNTWSESSLADALYAYADERFARQIARAIVAARSVKPLKTTGDLIACVHKGVPKKLHYARIHPATKTFQALRIAVNDEVDALSEFIAGSTGVLRSTGRLAIITFHSIEDRIVKQAFKKLSEEHKALVVTKKPLTPSDEEREANPRSRSAKLRILAML